MSNDNVELPEPARAVSASDQSPGGVSLESLKQDFDALFEAFGDLGSDLARGTAPTLVGRRILTRMDPSFWTDGDVIEATTTEPEESPDRIVFKVVFETDTGRWFVTDGHRNSYTDYPDTALEGILALRLNDEG